MTAFTFTRVKQENVLNRGASTTVVATFDVDVETSSAGLASGDTISGINVPQFATVTGYYLIFPELDSNGTPTGTFDLGDAADADRYLNGVVMGGSLTHYAYNEKDADLPGALVSTVGDTTNTPSNGVGFTYTADGVISLTVATAVATAVTSGTLVLAVTYTDNAV